MRALSAVCRWASTCCTVLIVWQAVLDVSQYLHWFGVVFCVLTGFLTSVPISLALLLLHKRWIDFVFTLFWIGLALVLNVIGRRFRLSAQKRAHEDDIDAGTISDTVVTQSRLTQQTKKQAALENQASVAIEENSERLLDYPVELEADNKPRFGLTQEKTTALFNDLRSFSEAGHLNYEWCDSLISLPQETYNAHWPASLDTQQSLRVIPGELLSYGFNGTDAYATALLATDTLLVEGCIMTVSCRYKRNDDDTLDLVYSSKTTAFTPELFGDRVVQFLHAFVPALAHKSIIPASPIFCDIVGAKSWFRSPGKMVFSSSILSKLPVDNWPVTMRTFKITTELRSSARSAVLLLNMHASKLSEQ